MQNKSPSINTKLIQATETAAAMLKFTDNSHNQSPMFSDMASHLTSKINQGPGVSEGSPYFSSSVLNKQPMDVIPEQIHIGAKANSLLNMQSSAL